ncbi:UNVERIFIED_CONTAM: hypothetical protein Sradi_3834600 [Sesamum radiatum]|uniref:Uncharacterized protein n=1 Tax=Sesamum radiatum TaxID=300843 RepID=A0AAW2Q1L3_SESRA
MPLILLLSLSQPWNLHLWNQDLDRLLGEAEAEVRDAFCQVESGAVEEKIPEEEFSQPVKEGAASPSKESQAQEKGAEVEEKTRVWGNLS